MNVAIIGSCGHCNYAIEAIIKREDLTLVAIAPGDDSEDMNNMVDSLNSIDVYPKLYDNYIKLLDNEDIQIVVVNPKFYLHDTISVEVLNRNIHLFIEKPISITIDGLNQMRKAYNKSNSKLCAMFGIRYEGSFLKAKRLIQDGAIGEIRIMDARKSYKLGNRSDMFKKRATYGGTISWVGSHAVDWMRYLSGYEMISVKALDSTKYNNSHGELELNAMCLFEFEDDVMGCVSIDYLRPKNAHNHGDDRIRIAGTKGVLEIRDGELYLINDDNDGIIPVENDEDKNIFDDFVDDIQGKCICKVSAEDSFRASEICLLAQRSADTKETIALI